MVNLIKGMVGLVVAVPLGVHVAGAIGSATAIPSGIRSATQSFVGLGLFGKAASLSKGFLK